MGRDGMWGLELSMGEWQWGGAGLSGKTAEEPGSTGRDGAVFGMGVEEGQAQGCTGGLKTQRLQEVGGKAEGPL